MTQAAWRLEVHESLRSTADRCRERAEEGEPEGFAVLARRQTAGRGTRGRSWAGAEGNLFLSVLLRPGGPAAAAIEWSLLAAVALADAVAALLPEEAPLRLKWPNDLLLQDGKLAGILLECGADGGGRLAWVCIGFGVNLAVAPVVPGRRTAGLAGYAPPSPEVFAWQLLQSLDRWRQRRACAGFAPVRRAFLARGPALGAPLCLRLGRERVEGVFAGLAPDGALLLAVGGQIRKFAAGEVTTGAVEAEEERAACCS